MTENENSKRGGISVETEHIFPIIKKWLYSEKEIFLREIVSNACDAATKLKRLSSLGEIAPIDTDALKIDVILDEDAKTITVRDNGIGMSEEELKKYICSIALSGALDFIEKYEGENGGDGIIGHFGLGFYSSFMVSDTVEIVTKSFTDAPAVKWVCTEDGEYEITEPDDDEIPKRGTAVIMHVSDGEREFLSSAKLREMLDQYCAFMAIPIYFDDGQQHEHHDEECDCEHEHEHEYEEKPVNDTNPLWLKNPSDCTEEEYREFYHKVFHDYREPLFWIHISADYPLNFKGILYFPKLANEYESLEGQIKLFYNQVFVADNIKEVIPEYLLMLRGVLDCPELPLNVSRSYLQNSSYVSKVSAHITKKVADKLNSLFNTEREKYAEIWNDIKTFVEYGCIRDRKFYDRVKESVLLPLTKGGAVTPDEYLESAKESHKDEIYYCNDKIAESQYIASYDKLGFDVVYLNTVIDTQFIGIIENDKKCKFLRVDAGVSDAMKKDGDVTADEGLEKLFRSVSGNDKLSVKFERLNDASIPAVITEDEQSRRMGDMMRIYGMGNDMQHEVSLSLNLENSLIDRLKGDPESESSEKIAAHIWKLSRLCRGELTADEMSEFVKESYEILEKI